MPSPGFAQVEKLHDFEDELKGEQFLYKDPMFVGVRETVDCTIRQGDRYSVIFKSGITKPVEELYEQMIKATDKIPWQPIQEEMILPSVGKIDGLEYANEPPINTNTISVQPIKTESPIVTLLKKAKLIEQEVPLIIKSLPKETFGILSDSFDNFLDEMVDYLFNSPDLKESIKISLIKHYNVENDKIEE